MPEDLNRLANALLKQAKDSGLTIVTAESCTAGLLAQILSDAEGSAEHFHGAFVTYTKSHKTCALGVPARVLHEQGAVCGTVARAMAEGALRHSTATLAAAITGVAGPAPDEDGNPVGRVWIAVARRGAATRDFEKNYGNIGREAVRERAVADALGALTDTASTTSASA